VKDKIAQKAQTLFFQRGIKAVSIDHIAGELGMSKKTIYTCFASKDEIVSYNIDLHIQENCCDIEANQKTAKNAIEELIGVYHMHYKSHSQTNPIYISDIKKLYPSEWKKMEQHFNEHIPKSIEANIQRGQSEGFYHSNFHPDFIAFLYMRSVISLIEFFSHQKSVSLMELTKEFIFYHIRAIGTTKGINYLSKIKLD
jgi:TetR/AcrR family transcriptional regulator, cholesterol catabolism regulator